jgi:hypothetical protein
MKCRQQAGLHVDAGTFARGVEPCHRWGIEGNQLRSSRPVQECDDSMRTILARRKVSTNSPSVGTES